MYNLFSINITFPIIAYIYKNKQTINLPVKNPNYYHNLFLLNHYYPALKSMTSRNQLSLHGTYPTRHKNELECFQVWYYHGLSIYYANGQFQLRAVWRLIKPAALTSIFVLDSIVLKFVFYAWTAPSYHLWISQRQCKSIKSRGSAISHCWWMDYSLFFQAQKVSWLVSLTQKICLRGIFLILAW